MLQLSLQPYKLKKIIGLLFVVTILSAPAKGADLNDDLLDQQYQEFSKYFYYDAATQNAPIFDNFTTLIQAIQKRHNHQQKIDAVILITANLELIQHNVDSPAVLGVLTLLLEQNEWHSANELFSTIQRDSNKTIVSNARFAMAKHYIKRDKWQRTLEYLDGIAGDLTEDDSDYANLMQGVALQQLKKHRLAIDVYEKFSPTSNLYPFTTLNLAVAYIRQDWWTDAHIAIEKLLKQPDQNTSDELKNRLNVILGYSLMQQGYYRNARYSFRNVTLDSQYTNQALLGIALTAISQNNYVGALNAINILKSGQGNDLPSEEAYLLLPFVYDKLGQHLTASASYSDAVGHYMQQIKSLKDILNNENNSNTDIKIINDHTFSINNYEIDIKNQAPRSLIDNYQLIDDFKAHMPDNEFEKKLQTLNATYNKYLNNITHNFINERTTHLNSYIDQSRYGLALLYDKSLAE